MELASITFIGTVRKVFRKGHTKGVIVTSAYLPALGEIVVYACSLPKEIKYGDKVWVTGKLVATDYVKVTSGNVMKFTTGRFEPQPAETPYQDELPSDDVVVEEDGE